MEKRIKKKYLKKQSIILQSLKSFSNVVIFVSSGLVFWKKILQNFTSCAFQWSSKLSKGFFHLCLESFSESLFLWDLQSNCSKSFMFNSRGWRRSKLRSLKFHTAGCCSRFCLLIVNHRNRNDWQFKSFHTHANVKLNFCYFWCRYLSFLKETRD